MLETICFTFIIISAGFLQGLTGFGFGLIALPLLSLFLPIQTIVPLVIMLALFINLTLAIQLRHSVRLKIIATLFIGTLPGIPLGIYMLKQVPSTYLAILVGVLMVSFTTYQLFVKPIPRTLGLPVTLFAGLSSGILTGSLSTGGPPVIVYTAMQPWTKDQAKGTLASYFLVSGVAAVAAHAASGIITADVMTHFAYMLPAMLIGVYSGMYAYKRISDHGYRKLAIILVLLLGIMMIARNI